MGQLELEQDLGLDYPMTAMDAARLGEPEKAVGALLMDKRTNTYLVNGATTIRTDACACTCRQWRLAYRRGDDVCRLGRFGRREPRIPERRYVERALGRLEADAVSVIYDLAIYYFTILVETSHL